jgi:hypothetical protein
MEENNMAKKDKAKKAINQRLREQHFTKWSARIDKLRREKKDITSAEERMAAAELAMIGLREYVDLMKKEFPDKSDAAEIVARSLQFHLSPY